MEDTLLAETPGKNPEGAAASPKGQAHVQRWQLENRSMDRLWQ